ncbi:hypothetical protein GQ457_12G025070 [Hibiscus cannabinus]
MHVLACAVLCLSLLGPHTPFLLTLLSPYIFISSFFVSDSLSRICSTSTKGSMRRPCDSLKREFLKKWMTGLQSCSSSNKDMSILERKKAIKLSADVAMACARNGATCWSRALIAAGAHSGHSNKRIRSKKILKRSCRIRTRRKRRSKCAAQVGRASWISVGKRTRILKSLIPGGESMNEASLVEETLDYITYLRAQVDGMRSLVDASELCRLGKWKWKLAGTVEACMYK